MSYKYEKGQLVFQRNHSGEIQETIIIDRRVINGQNAYKTELITTWENEVFIYPS